MTDIDRQIAEQVMGWKKSILPIPNCVPEEFIWLDGISTVNINNFHPSTNISDAWLVEETLMEKGLTCEYIDALIEITNILVFDSDKSKQVFNYRLTSSVIFLLVHATPEQRCKAALEAVSN